MPGQIGATVRIGEHIEARWTGGGDSDGGRELEVWDRVSGNKIVLDTRAARMLAALVHVEVSEQKTKKAR